MTKWTIPDMIPRAEHEARVAEAVAAERERCAKVADECQRQNGPASRKGFHEHYRAGLEAGAQAIAAAIRAQEKE